MGYSVGNDRRRERHIGYGVPAICDQPGCGTSIDRGMDYACGGYGRWDGTCGLYFCGNHLSYAYLDDEDETLLMDGDSVCDVCLANAIRESKEMDLLPWHEPTEDTYEWAYHVVNDESWAPFRSEYPEWTDRYRAIVLKHPSQVYDDRRLTDWDDKY